MAIRFHGLVSAPLVDFSAEAPDGAVIGIIGRNGAGARELIEIASGRMSVPASMLERSGEVRTFGEDIAFDDAYERRRRLYEIERLRRSGATVLVHSHNEEWLGSVCDEVWLVENTLIARGHPAEVLDRYRRLVAKSLKGGGHLQSFDLPPSMRRGDGRATLERIQTLSSQGSPTSVWAAGEEVAVGIQVRFHAPVDDPVVGIMIRTRIGFEVYGTNTELEKVKLGPCVAGDVRLVTFTFVCNLCPQEYTLTAASHDPDGIWHDWVEDAIAFTVVDGRYTAGVANLRAQVRTS